MHTKPFNVNVYLVSPELREKTPSVKSVLLAGNPLGAAKTNMKKNIYSYKVRYVKCLCSIKI